MTNQTNINFRPATYADRPAIVRFYDSIREELYLKSSDDVTTMCDKFFAHGGAMVGCDRGEIIATLGYFLGDPSDGFADKQVGFIYVAGLDPAYRHSGAFRAGLTETIKHFVMMGLQEVRLHALQSDERLNGIYSSFMQSREPQKNMRGIPCYRYRSSVAHILRFAANNRPKPQTPRRFDPAPMGMQAQAFTAFV